MNRNTKRLRLLNYLRHMVRLSTFNTSTTDISRPHRRLTNGNIRRIHLVIIMVTIRGHRINNRPVIPHNNFSSNLPDIKNFQFRHLNITQLRIRGRIMHQTFMTTQVNRMNNRHVTRIMLRTRTSKPTVLIRQSQTTNNQLGTTSNNNKNKGTTIVMFRIIINPTRTNSTTGVQDRIRHTFTGRHMTITNNNMVNGTPISNN